METLERNPTITAASLVNNSRFNLSAELKRSKFRRLSNRYEAKVSSDQLCQSIHVSELKGKSVERVATPTDSYSTHTLDTVFEEIDTLLGLGIKSCFLQIQAPSGVESYRAKLDHSSKVIRSIKERYGKEFFVITDSQGLCMNDDLTWGIKNSSHPEIDAEATLDLIVDTCVSFSDAGLDSFMTIGRINYEVLVAKTALKKIASKMKLYSFSSNSETPNAYFETPGYSYTKSITGQKILVGNVFEMILRSLRDIYEGVDVVVQKPLENVHILSVLQSLASDTTALETYLDLADNKRLIAEAAFLFEDGFLHSDLLRQRLNACKISAYEVSGTYYIYKSIEREHGPGLAFGMLDEQFKNIISICGTQFDRIISRNSKWHAQNAAKYRL